MVDFRIQVVVDPSRSRAGTQIVNRDLNKIAASADRVRRLIGRAFLFGGIATALRQLTKLVDSFTNIQNRLKTVTDGTAELAVVTEELFELSNRTRQSFESTVEVYTRTALATRNLAISQKELLEFTESLNKAVILSGAASQEASAGLLQLSQGLSAGRLGGEELRSVLEQLPVVADVIAKQMKVTRGELRELGSQGKITAEVVLDAFKAARQELGVRFAETVPTIGQSFAILRNNIVRIVGAFGKATQFTERFARVILFLSNNIETLGRLVLAVSVIIGVGFAVKAVGAALSGLRGLFILIATNPIGAMIITLGIVIALMIAWSDEIQLSEDHLSNLQDFGGATFQILSETFADFFNQFAKLFPDIAKIAKDTFNDMDLSVLGVVRFLADALDLYMNLWRGAFRAVVVLWRTMPAVFGDIFNQLVQAAGDSAADVVNAIIAQINKLRVLLNREKLFANIEFKGPKNQFAGAAADAGKETAAAFLSALGGRVARNALEEQILPESERRAQERINREKAEAIEIAKVRTDLGRTGTKRIVTPPSLLRDLDREILLLKLGRREREIQNKVFEAEKRIRKDLLPAQEKLVRARANEILQLQDAEILQDRNKDLENEIKVLGLSRREREIRAELLGVETELQRELGNVEAKRLGDNLVKRRELNETDIIEDTIKGLDRQITLLGVEQGERQALAIILQLEAQFNDDLTEAVERQIKAKVKLIQQMQVEQDVLTSLRGDQDALIKRMEAINSLFTRGAITIDEYNNAIRDVRLDELSTQLDIGAGIERGVLKAQKLFEDLATGAENAVTNAFQNMEDALTKFIATGEIDFEDFINQLKNDLARLAARDFLNQVFGSLSLPGSTGGGVSIGGFDLGGVFSAGVSTLSAGLSSLGSLFGAGVGPSVGGFFGTGAFSHGGIGVVPGPTSPAFGPDNRVVALTHMRSGEEVQVGQPGEFSKRRGAGVSIGKIIIHEANRENDFGMTERQRDRKVTRRVARAGAK